MNPHTRLSTAFLRSRPAGAARVLENFPAESTAKYLVAATPVTAQRIIENFTPGYAASCLLAIEPSTAGQIFTRLPLDLQIILLRQLDRNKCETILGSVPSDLAASLRRQLPYPAGTAGALMEAPLASVPDSLTVRDALKRIRRNKRGMKFYIYAVNQSGQLTGILSLHELISASPGSIINQIMRKHIYSLSPAQSALTVFKSPYWQDYYALPVTDENNVLLGIIRHKHLRRLQDQSAQTGALNEGLGAFVAAGELFSVTAGHVLSLLISLITSPGKRTNRG
jgi:magnesium transporter